MKPIRLAIVDDHALFRAGLISLLKNMEEFSVVGEASDGEEACELVRKVKPDILLLDVHMPGLGGVATVEQLRRFPAEMQPRILMLTISKKDTDLLGAIAAGADGYLLKNAEPQELRNAILKAHQGMAVLSPQVTRQVLQAAMGNTIAPQNTSGLSEREIEVLECLAEGLTTGGIANKLFISENTVKTHVRHILEKLDASNRAEAVSKAIQQGIIRRAQDSD